MTGLVFCSVIEACQEVYAFGRAREWTAALAQWCEEQPEMVAFTGVCLVHRAEIMQLRGAWQEAIEEAQRACERSPGVSRQTAAAAFYQQAEVHRLRGEFAAAEAAYRSASHWAWSRSRASPCCGWRKDAPTPRRCDPPRLSATAPTGCSAPSCCPPTSRSCLPQATSRTRVPPAASSRRSRRLRYGRAGRHGRARPRRDRAGWKATLAPRSARCARFEAWQQIEAPYAAARVRVLIGLACRALGDDDGGGLELDGGEAVFEQLSARRISPASTRSPEAHHRAAPIG